MRSSKEAKSLRKGLLHKLLRFRRVTRNLPRKRQKKLKRNQLKKLNLFRIRKTLLQRRKISKQRKRERNKKLKIKLIRRQVNLKKRKMRLIVVRRKKMIWKIWKKSKKTLK